MSELNPPSQSRLPSHQFLKPIMTILDAVYPNGRTHGFCLLGFVGVVMGGPACGVIWSNACVVGDCVFFFLFVISNLQVAGILQSSSMPSRHFCQDLER